MLTHSRPDLDLETHRRELAGYCYRMLGSWWEAEDAVQETMVRAWRSADRLQSEAALRGWLYRIATNVCLDELQGAKRRARPMDFNEPATADAALSPGLPEMTWIQPAPDAGLLPAGADPAELTALRETVRLAFVAALQHPPPRQRAVLILRDVLRWKATEVAELLDTTVVSVNSALQRARTTLDSLDLEPSGPAQVEEEQRDLLDRYVSAFERYDVAELVTLLHDDATFSMPPHELWLRGSAEVGRWMLGTGIGCRGAKLRTTWANGCPAVAIYKPDGHGGHAPFNVAVLEMTGGRIAAIHNFLYPAAFAAFGLPAEV